ncbi:MAG: winged helix-turn-helix domain-containing protein [Steroidobacteraceae bacterium]
MQIADDLRAKITDGTYPVGSALPSTSHLMRSYEVSITVARAAVKELQNEGLVLGQPGKAVYVRQEPEPTQPSPEYIEVMQQIKALREAMTETAAGLDARLTALEKAARRSRGKQR